MSTTQHNYSDKPCWRNIFSVNLISRYDNAHPEIQTFINTKIYFKISTCIFHSIKLPVSLRIPRTRSSILIQLFCGMDFHCSVFKMQFIIHMQSYGIGSNFIMVTVKWKNTAPCKDFISVYEDVFSINTQVTLQEFLTLQDKFFVSWELFQIMKTIPNPIETDFEW